MVAIGLSGDAVARIRLAISGLWEVIASIRVLRQPRAHAIHLPWVRQVRPALSGAGLIESTSGLLWQLIPPAPGYLPDFLTPEPQGPSTDLAEELALLRDTPFEVVRSQLGSGQVAAAAALSADPAAGLRRIADEVQAYWDIALAPYWPRIHTLLESDVYHQARRLAEGGAAVLLNELHHQVRWDESTLSITQRFCTAADVAAGHGLVLIPSCFVWPSVLSVPLGESPQLAYPAGGIATLWEPQARAAAPPLSAVIGRSRARLLAEMRVPVSTTELARRTGISAGGVSQQLAVLRAAGLVTSHRHGKSMLNTRTTAADTLLSAAP